MTQIPVNTMSALLWKLGHTEKFQGYIQFYKWLNNVYQNFVYLKVFLNF